MAKRRDVPVALKLEQREMSPGWQKLRLTYGPGLIVSDAAGGFASNGTRKLRRGEDSFGLRNCQ